MWKIKEQKVNAGYNMYKYSMEFASLCYLFYFAHFRIKRLFPFAMGFAFSRGLRCFCWFLFLLQTLAIKCVIRNCEKTDLSSCVHSVSHRANELCSQNGKWQQLDKLIAGKRQGSIVSMHEILYSERIMFVVQSWNVFMIRDFLIQFTSHKNYDLMMNKKIAPTEKWCKTKSTEAQSMCYQSNNIKETCVQ